MNKINTDYQAQLKRFRTGFPYLEIISSATKGRGIEVLSKEEEDQAAAYAESASTEGRCKFVPASGAASRMFKAIFAGMQTPNAETVKLAENLEKFAFYDPTVFGKTPYDPCKTADRLLTSEGLDYGNKPKGVLKFHR